MANTQLKDEDFIRQRPLSLPRTLADFLDMAANSYGLSINGCLVKIVEKTLPEIAHKKFKDELYSQKPFANDSSIKLLVRLPVALDDELSKLGKKYDKSANLLIFQALLAAYEKSPKPVRSCS